MRPARAAVEPGIWPDVEDGDPIEELATHGCGDLDGLSVSWTATLSSVAMVRHKPGAICQASHHPDIWQASDRFAWIRSGPRDI
jgi:hypothetical protein